MHNHDSLALHLTRSKRRR